MSTVVLLSVFNHGNPSAAPAVPDSLEPYTVTRLPGESAGPLLAASTTPPLLMIGTSGFAETPIATDAVAESAEAGSLAVAVSVTPVATGFTAAQVPVNVPLRSDSNGNIGSPF